jgi:hypothetical protein
MVHKQVYLRTVVLDVPAEYCRIRGLEHGFLDAKLAYDLADHVGTPGAHTFGDPFRFDHNHVRPGIKMPFRPHNGPVRVARPFRLQLLNGAGAAGAELDSYFGLNF